METVKHVRYIFNNENKLGPKHFQDTLQMSFLEK